MFRSTSKFNRCIPDQLSRANVATTPQYVLTRTNSSGRKMAFMFNIINLPQVFSHPGNTAEQFCCFFRPMCHERFHMEQHLILSVIRTHPKQPVRHRFSAAPWPKMQMENRSRLTNSHYPDVFALFVAAPLTQLRNQQEFLSSAPVCCL